MTDVTVTVASKGPYLVQGPFELKDSDGGVFSVNQEMVALCRCGSSARKPFCDGTHARIGFTDTARAAATPPTA